MTPTPTAPPTVDLDDLERALAEYQATKPFSSAREKALLTLGPTLRLAAPALIASARREQRMAEALAKYGCHTGGCRSRKPLPFSEKRREECDWNSFDCGFAAALGAEQGGQG